VRRLVLTVTSGGVDMTGLGASDWRASYRKSFPLAASWIYEPRAAGPLPVEKIAAPTLLLWGDADPISPVAVGRHLEARILDARLHIVAGGDHDLAQTHAAEVAPLIARHLG
jgi:pimeloyl-ACP methyl ester carboxylesterase